MRYFQRVFFFLFLFLDRPIFAQIAKWIEPQSGNFYQINFETKEFFENKDGVHWNKIATLSFENIKTHDLIYGSGDYQSLSIPRSTLSYLLVSCTGQVYELDRKNWILKRLDKTFFRGANCNSFKFIRKGVPYSFGGYGFWRSTNILTKFNQLSKEWVSIGALGELPESIFNGISGYVPSKDVFISMANVGVNDSRSNNYIMVDWGIYEYKFDTNEFKKIGTLYNEEVKKLLGKDFKGKYLFNGRYFILVDESQYLYRYDTMYIIDVLDHFKTYCWLNSNRFKVQNDNFSYDERDIHFKGKDTLVWVSSFSTNNKIDKKTLHYALSINDIIADSNFIGSSNVGPWYIEFLNAIVSSIGVIFFTYFIFLFRKLRRIRLKRNMKNILSENEKRFLELLLLNYKDGYINGHQIIAYFNLQKSAPESQRQFRSRLIDNFTKSLHLIFQDANVLDVEKDSIDHRMLNYRLNGKIYKILSKNYSYF